MNDTRASSPRTAFQLVAVSANWKRAKRESTFYVWAGLWRDPAYVCLPHTIDAGHINANCVIGVLTIELTKRASAEPKPVPVLVGQMALGTGATARAA